MTTTKLDIVTIKGKEDDNIPEVLLISEKTILKSGTWMTSIEEFIQGFIYALELADHKVEITKTELISSDLKKDITIENIINYHKNHG